MCIKILCVRSFCENILHFTSFSDLHNSFKRNLDFLQVNSPDENGLLEGNWSEDFSGGVPPTKWTGSVKILQKYYSNRKPVKFAQCWVFSGVVTTGNFSVLYCFKVSLLSKYYS